jgi:hypothetical protein
MSGQYFYSDADDDDDGYNEGLREVHWKVQLWVTSQSFPLCSLQIQNDQYRNRAKAYMSLVLIIYASILVLKFLEFETSQF